MFAHDLQHECIPTVNLKASLVNTLEFAKDRLHIPWSPMVNAYLILITLF